MRRSSSFLSVLCALATAATVSAWGRTSAAIVDGERDDTDAVVSIGDVKEPLCSGTVIGARLVLTAAHCVTESNLKVNIDGEPVDVLAARVHPQFDPETMEHDIAILILSENAWVTPMPLATKAPPSEGDRVRFVGWGRTKHGGATKGRRGGYVKVDEVDYKQFKTVPDPSTACGRDSGGAVMDEDGTRLVGVISSGDTKCEKYAYATRLDVHRTFIDTTMSEFEGGGCNAGGAPATAPAAVEAMLAVSLVAAIRRLFERASTRAQDQRNQS